MSDLTLDYLAKRKYVDSECGRRMVDRLNSVSASEAIGVAIVTVEERFHGMTSFSQPDLA